MTTYKFVSVQEYRSGPREGERMLKFGDIDSTGADIKISTPENDVDGLMLKMEWTKILSYKLPERMTSDDAREWIEEEQPEAVWAALDKEMEGDDANAG